MSTCKLYRNVKDILNPSISRKNISNYQIIFKEELTPVRVFYPNINVDLNKIVIYVHGREICPDFYEEYALKTNNIVILIDYSKEHSLEDLEACIKFIIEELRKAKIDYSNISLVGDFTGADTILELIDVMDVDTYNSIDKILISPIDDDLKDYDILNTLVLSNNEEQTPNDKMDYHLLKESLYDFIHDIDIVTNEKIYNYILDFIER